MTNKPLTATGVMDDTIIISLGLALSPRNAPSANPAKPAAHAYELMPHPGCNFCIIMFPTIVKMMNNA